MSDRLIMAFDRSERWKDEDGHLHVRLTNISKATVNGYRGSEIPGADSLGLDPDRVYMLLRDPTELAAAASTFNNIRLLSRHVPVSPTESHEELVAGSTGTDAVFEMPYLRNSLVIWRAEDIADVESREKCELSCGYRYEPDMTPGEWNGLRYDGVMRQIRGNHVALVEAGRAGPDVMVHDSGKPHMPKALTSRKALLVKGALTSLLKPKLLAGTALALDAQLGGVNRANWKTEKGKVIDAVAAWAKTRIAPEHALALDELRGAMDKMDDEDDGDAEDDEIESMDARRARDEEEEEEEKKKKEAEDKRARDARRRGKDESPEEKEKREREEKEAEDMRAAKDKKAMDAAIETGIATATAKLRADMLAAATAREAVRPLIGTVPVAMDSAEDIYRLALDHYRVDIKDVPAAAFPKMVQMIRKPGERDVTPRFALDAGGPQSAAEMFPQMARFG